MTRIAISAQGLGKQYIIGGRDQIYGSFREMLGGLFTAPFRRFRTLSGKVQDDERFWALKDIDFDIRQGEVLGVIGKNGAGKSTLLKILSRITSPTRGRVVIRGRVASLLEVGTGFHPELTGRENILLNGSILGMSRRDINQRLDEIVSFAEIEKFVDTPVKRYSSGMYVRLAFAVAAHLEPDILIVDEVLAVGDAGFQRKCLGKMQDVSQLGRTVIFVSHNLVSVQNLCDRAVYLSCGRIESDGLVGEVISRYLVDNSSGFLMESNWPDRENAPGNQFLAIKKVAVTPKDTCQAGDLMTLPYRTSDRIAVQFQYWVLQSEQNLHLTIHVKNERGLTVFSSTNADELLENPIRLDVGTYQSVCVIPGNLLNVGHYRIDLLIVRDGSNVLTTVDSIAGFAVEEGDRRSASYYGKEPGVIRPRLKWETTSLNDSPLYVESKNQA